MTFDATLPVIRGREDIERNWAGFFKTVGGHYTIVIKDAIPVGDDVVVATDELKITGVGQNADKTVDGRAVITLAKTPDG